MSTEVDQTLVYTRGVISSQGLELGLILLQLRIVYHRTFLKNCPFVIKIRTRLDGQRLYVKEICGDHNHELPEVLT